MLKLIIGVKGTGKTKQLIDLVNASLKSSQGSVVCIEKGDKLKFDVNYQCRLIDTEYYGIGDAAALYGFVAGILASNHDVTDLYIDSALKICGDDIAAFDQFLGMVDMLTSRSNINCVMTCSLAIDNASEAIQKYV